MLCLFTHLAVFILIVLIILTSRGVSHNPVAMFYVAYALTLKKELRFYCFVCKVRDQVEEQLSFDCVVCKVRDDAEETVEL
jgi:hypothetical protein